MEAIRLFKSLNPVQRKTFLACFLGWALDALDFFLLTFVLVPVAHDFGRSIPQVAFAITLTLLMRPVGAFIFGLLGDRFGRRIPLMADIIFYSLMELLTAFAPNFTVFLILRALFGIGMGGEWGLGASLAMESLPTHARGLFSGILQQGYAFGYLLAALVYWIVFPFFGWRGLFVAGALPAIPRDLHPGARSGIAGLGAAPQSKTRNAFQCYSVHQAARKIVHLRGASDDRVQLHVARHAGSLCDVSGKAARLWRQPKIDHHHRLCDRRDLRRNGHRVHVATLGTPTVDHFVGCVRHASDSNLDFRARHRPPHPGRVSHAIHGARRVGRCARALERTVAAGFSRNLSGTRLSTWKLRRGLCRATTGMAG